MRRVRFLRRCLFALLAALPGVALAEDSADEQFAARVLPLVKQFCIECHSGNEPEGELRLDDFDRATHVNDHPELWEDIAEKLHRREMPPAEKPQPSAEKLAAATTWIDARLVKLAEAMKPSPGRVTMRRLNRVEYNNTIRDLVGVDFHPADDFPVDDTGYGFDNIGDVLSLPSILMEKYLAAAEQIVDKAIIENVPADVIASFEGKTFKHADGSGRNQDAIYLFTSEGFAEVEANIPRKELYELRIKAFADQAGSDPARMSVRVDGQEIKLVDVPATRDEPGEYVLPWKLNEGNHKFGVAFVNDFYNPKSQDPASRDRNLYVASLEIRAVGESAWAKLPESHRRIIARSPTPENRSQLAKESLARFARRAYRRGVGGDEINRLFRLYQQAERDGASFEQAMKVALQGVLVSPNFLFRIEIDPQGDGADGARELNEFEVASRLSYFLWSSTPDDALLEAAKIRALKREKLAEQVQRMLEDPKSAALVKNFAGQWLQLRKLNLITPDPDRFPQYSTALRDDMQRETELFFEAVMREDRPITDLLDADFTFVNERLAKHYGIEGVQGDEFRRVNVSRETRGGLLTQASVLTLTSNPTRSSPVKRGKWVLDNLLGEPPPPPPPGVPELPEEKPGEVVGSLRVRMEQHRAPNACGVCHSRIDPLGFGLENYDAVGVWRTSDADGAIDTSGKLPDGSSFNGPRELKNLLVSRKGDFARALAEKMLTYALGRGLTRADRPAVEKIVVRVKEHDYKFKSLVLAVVESDPFLKKATGETP